MTSSQQPIEITTTREDHRIAWLATLAISVHILESALPSPFPGIKPGLANVITLITFCLFGFRSAMWVSVLRVVVGSLLIGTFLSPTFVLSLSGALASLLVLGLIAAVGFKGFSPVGLAVLAAAAHTLAQFGAAYIFFIPHRGLFNLLPIFMTAGLAFGIVSGMIAAYALNGINEQEQAS